MIPRISLCGLASVEDFETSSRHLSALLENGKVEQPAHSYVKVSEWQSKKVSLAVLSPFPVVAGLLSGELTLPVAHPIPFSETK